MSNPLLEVPLVAVLPFAALLGSIAVLPLTAPHFWERARSQALVAFGLAAPVAAWLVLRASAALAHSALEYVSFMALLGALYVVSGGVFVSGDLRATPRNNTLLLAIGAVLANLVGTTGASALLVRLVLRTNRQRRHVTHLTPCFILLVSNCGGLLTPLGDPPLFLGYLRGVPFTWTLRLWPIWLGTVAWLLLVFYLLDRRAYAREPDEALAQDDTEQKPLGVLGVRNLGWLALVLAAVFLPTPWRELGMIGAALGSRFLGGAVDREARHKNGFNLGPIREVAILFAGIFVTMTPALALLERHGRALGVDAPWQFFLGTGVLSSVLDNAPTYLTFLATAQAQGLAPEVVGVPHLHLMAISAGAVLMGANTYIGNGPNFMVKAIADAMGYRTPSFAAYALFALSALAPVYLVLTLIFLALG
jgi:Na+/H+ antiporter NhaD/arsenite permease-like protein